MRRPETSSETGRNVAESSNQLGTTDQNPNISHDEKEGEPEASQSSNPTVFTTGDCRYCYGPEEASDTDPMIKVGCQCKGDNSNGHESCLMRWYQEHLPSTLQLDCEVCRTPFGAHLKSIILTRNLPVQPPPPTGTFFTPWVLILLHVPPEDLDRLQVPVETPPVAELPVETRAAIGASLSSQEEKQLYEVSRLGRLFENADAGSKSQAPLEIFARAIMAVELIDQFVDMVSVTEIMQDPAEEERRMALFPLGGGPGGDMTIKILVQGERERGEILRVPAPGPLAPVTQKLLEDVTLNTEFLFLQHSKGEARGGSLTMLPRCMIVDNIYTVGAPNNVAAGPGPSARHEEVAPPARRHFTYGRYQRFPLFTTV